MFQKVQITTHCSISGLMAAPHYGFLRKDEHEYLFVAMENQQNHSPNKNVHEENEYK